MRIIQAIRQAGGRRRRQLGRLALVSALVVGACAIVSPRVIASGSWNYTALGDSVAFGAFAPVGYVQQYGLYVGYDNGRWVNTYDLGIPGWTSHDLLNALQNNRVVQRAVHNSHVVTWSVGGDDLSAARNLYKAGTCGGAQNTDCLAATVATLESNWDGIIAAIHQLRDGTTTIVRTMDIYNPFVNVDKASDSWANDGGLNDFQAMEPFLDEVNAYIKTSSEAQGILVAPVHYWFNGASGDQDPSSLGLLAFDNYHPNQKGHNLIAYLLRNLGYSTVHF